MRSNRLPYHLISSLTLQNPDLWTVSFEGGIAVKEITHASEHLTRSAVKREQENIPKEDSLNVAVNTLDVQNAPPRPKFIPLLGCRNSVPIVDDVKPKHIVAQQEISKNQDLTQKLESDKSIDVSASPSLVEFSQRK